MRKIIMALIAIIVVAISSCSESTNLMGDSLTSNINKYEITTDTFDVSTQSIKVDSVLSRSVYSYIGRLKDPETGSYIVSDYMTQFHILENQTKNLFPDVTDLEDDLDFDFVADSCFVRIIVNSYQGDSLAAMKLSLRELSKLAIDYSDGVIAGCKNVDKNLLKYAASNNIPTLSYPGEDFQNAYEEFYDKI